MEMKFNEIPVPKELDRVVEESLNQIYKKNKMKSRKKAAAGLGAAAAILLFGVFLCISNPTLAAKIPLIGHIFEQLQKEYGYSGDYTKVKEDLTDAKTVDGVTVTLSEIYCNGQGLYLTLRIESEEEIPELLDRFQCETIEKYSFNPKEQRDDPLIDGKYVDQNTYIGIMRFDLNDKNKYTDGEPPADENGMVTLNKENADSYLKDAEIPDQYTLDLEISDIEAPLKNSEDKEKAEKNMTKEELEETGGEGALIYHGPWKFTLNVSKNTQDTQSIVLNDLNKKGIGIEKVVKDRVEITIYDTYKEGVSKDYFPVVLDSDGRLMDNSDIGGLVNTVAIQDRDVSKIDVFLIDYVKWMDELKGDQWKEENAPVEDGQTYKELLMDECDYHKEIVFE